MAGINIPFLSNVRDFLKGTGDVEGALDDVADSLDDMAGEAENAARQSARSLGDVSDSLDDVARDSRDAGDDLGSSMDGAAREAEDAAARLERSFRDSLDAVRTESADAGSAVGRDMDEGTREASEGLTQMGEEGAANAREVAASFDGSASSIADGFQGLAAEALGGFGPLGAAAGIAVAAGMGLAMSSMEKAKEEAQETAEAIAEIAGEMIDLGSSERGPEQVADALTEMATSAEDGENQLKSIKETADDLGISYADLANGMAGDSEAAARAIAELNGKIDDEKTAQGLLTAEITRKQNALSDEGRAMAAQSAAHTDMIEKLESGKTSLLEELGVLEEGTEIFELHTEAVEGGAAAQVAATEATEAATEAREELTETTRTAITSELDYLDAIAAGTEALAENAAAGLDKNTVAGRENIRTIDTMVQSVRDHADAVLAQTGDQAAANAVIEEGRVKIKAAGDAAGLSADEVDGYATSLGLVPGTVDTAVAVTGTATAKTELDGLTAPRTVSLTPVADLFSWQRVLDNTAAGLRAPSVQVAPKIGMSAN